MVESFVVEEAVFVHPHFRHSNGVTSNRMQLSRSNVPLMRTARPEDVTHVTAGVDFQRPPAHPDLYSRTKVKVKDGGTFQVEKGETLKDISRFSPPQNSIPGSYFPRCSNQSRWIENKPPAIVGELQPTKKQLFNCIALLINTIFTSTTYISESILEPRN